MNHTAVWHGCYDEGWGDAIVPEAFSHPAKMARGLLERIILHGFERGYWEKGSWVADCFSGVGTTGIVGAYHGLRTIGVELEPRFHALALENLELHRRKLETLGYPLPIFLRGDSRAFSSIVKEQLAACITSPPYAESLQGEKHGIDFSKAKKGSQRGSTGRDALGGEYGQSPGQIGALKAGDLDAALTSPPYARSEVFGGDHNKGMRGERPGAKAEQRGEYGKTEGQIGQLPTGDLDAVVTSPPFADSTLTTDKEFIAEVECDQRRGSRFQGGNTDAYGSAEGQIGRESQGTYWESVAQVYCECFKALRPGGYMVLVVKDFVKAKKRVPLCDQTLELLIHLGFQPVERIRAMLVKETRHPSLFGGEHVETKSRKSFFRRLAEAKGSPKIDYEEILWCKKP